MALKPWAFKPLPLGTVKPSGWLATEIDAVANGLAGLEYEICAYVGNSRWLHPAGSDKGYDYSALNEALPYWLNSLVPLAYLADSSRLKDQVDDVVRRVLKLANDTDDGWLGPETKNDKRNFWGRTPLVMGLLQLVEVDPKWESQVIPVMKRYFNLTLDMVRDGGRGHNDGVEQGWGQTRVMDTIYTIQWLYERQPHQDLWELMELLDKYTTYRWDNWYGSKDYPQVVIQPKVESERFPYLHGVNVGQGLKYSAVAKRFRPDGDGHADCAKSFDLCMRCHGAPSGTILADEMQTDSAPYIGSELCMHVETAFSMAYNALALGEDRYAAHAERVMFNAYPCAFVDDYCSHQYMTQPNQPWAKVNSKDYEDGEKLFTTAHSGVATTFGIEPQYPCCTVNFAQAWPKYVAWSWGIKGNVLAHLLLGPATVDVDLPSGRVKATCDTRYPFEDELEYTFNSSAPFDFAFRSPGSGLMKYAGQTASLKSGLNVLAVPSGTSRFTVVTNVGINVESRPSGAVSIYRGSLLYALEIQAEDSTVASLPFDNARGEGKHFSDKRLIDHRLTNKTAWNIAIDPSTIKYHPQEHFDDSGSAFVGKNTAYMTVQGCEVDWPLHLGVTPDWPPRDPKPTGEVKEYRLIPYGRAKLHMSELPVISLSQ